MVIRELFYSMKISTLYYTYIATCSDGTFYVGITKNLEKRLKQHNGILKGGAKYTKGRRPLLMSYYEKHPDHKSAAQREYILKQLTHLQKEALCKFPSA